MYDVINACPTCEDQYRSDVLTQMRQEFESFGDDGETFEEYVEDNLREFVSRVRQLVESHDGWQH